MRKQAVALFFILSLSMNAHAKITITLNENLPPKGKLLLTDYDESFQKNILTCIGNENFHVEAFSRKTDSISVSQANPFMVALEKSYNQHLPLVISPDMIWLLICQSIGIHIEEHADSLRNLFVDFEGKKEIKVRRDNFIKGRKDNPWQEVFPEFSKQIKTYLKEDLFEYLVTEFSTTGSVEKTVYEMTCMFSLKKYFFYQVIELCGIPSITLEGEPEDWQLIVTKFKALNPAFGLDWWVQELSPVLEKFINASLGNIDQEHWKGIFKYTPPDSICGSVPYVNGWISKFFPYIRNERDQYILNKNFSKDLTFDEFPNGLNKMDFIYEQIRSNYSKKYQMLFVSGFIGISQDKPSKVLRPEIGWVVVDCSDKWASPYLK